MLSIKNSAIGALLCLTACGSGKGGSDASTAPSTIYRINLLSHEPAADAVQVATDTQITLRFDADMVLDCFQDEDTWLRAANSSTDIPGTFQLAAGGSSVVFTPNAPLNQETDYVFQASPLTCDRDGRLLEYTTAFSFRTLDTTPPSIVSANVTNGETGRSRNAPLVVTASEALSTASATGHAVLLRDAFSQLYSCQLTIDGENLVIQPSADLPGDRLFTLLVGSGITDRAGNALTNTWSVAFRTAVDLQPPSITSIWPASGSTNISPSIEPIVTFDESMAPSTVEPSSLTFQDQFGSLVAFQIVASADQRTLRVRPLETLEANRHYFMAFSVSAAAVTDVSGNPLANTFPLSFTTGDDGTPPVPVSIGPVDGETRISLNVTPEVIFDQALDPNWVNSTTVELLQDGELVPCVVDNPQPSTIRLSPILPLIQSTGYTIRLASGHDGIRDLAGNVMFADVESTFTTSADGSLPGALLQPGDGTATVPPSAHISIVFDSVMDIATLNAQTCELRTDTHLPIPATLDISGGGRVVTLTPHTPLSPQTYYRTYIRGGPNGVREVSGNWLASDLNARYRTSLSNDLVSPSVSLTVNGIDAQRRGDIALPPLDFTIDVEATDPEDSLDMGSVQVLLSGPGTAPGSASLFATAEVGFGSFRTTMPQSLALAPGNWTLSVRVSDLSGNSRLATNLPIEITEPTTGLLPFEQTQVVWARTDLDRDGNGRGDFEDDLLRLGFATAGDPAGLNEQMRRIVLDAILAKSNDLFGRGSRGEPIDQDSVRIRFSTHEPIALAHQQMALGGLDPEGSQSRGYGDLSTGILGRAYYDYRNANINDRNIGSSPGLGVFPAEMWLYQTEIHQQVFPGFQTRFAQRFLPLCPDMGGTPVGSHPDDPSVIANDFDPDNASTSQRARHTEIMSALDDWSAAMGTILAHEVGHAVGLTAPGPAPGGLFGDSSLHNDGFAAAEVMAATVGYEAMVALDYNFRDLNLAYLRQRILLR
ncbi:MAG: Ig-like domain-containing protein [Planctomycetota bacterium]|nr:Ig-like domain-containing protein [Planctomycetota bacterium]